MPTTQIKKFLNCISKQQNSFLFGKEKSEKKESIQEIIFFKSYLLNLIIKKWSTLYLNYLTVTEHLKSRMFSPWNVFSSVSVKHIFWFSSQLVWLALLCHPTFSSHSLHVKLVLGLVPSFTYTFSLGDIILRALNFINLLTTKTFFSYENSF